MRRGVVVDVTGILTSLGVAVLLLASWVLSNNLLAPLFVGSITFLAMLLKGEPVQFRL